MLRKFLDFSLSLTQKGRPLHRLHPLVNAADTFFYEPAVNTQTGPHIRDAIDLKRWMTIVIFALFPCIFMSIWNSGVQKFVYTSGDWQLMEDFFLASTSLKGYFLFVLKDSRYLTILQYGLMAFLPVMFISYAVGGFWEVLFAIVRRHDIAEGFFVTGMLYPLILPSTIPYWMVAVGVSAGVVISKELFGGTGHNILNPALACRAFLFFSFPVKMSGDVWAGTNTTITRQSLSTINAEAPVDGYTQATHLAKLNISEEVKRIHVDAIATNDLGYKASSTNVIESQLAQWNITNGQEVDLGQLSSGQMQQFLTTPLADGGLGLPPDQYQAAQNFAQLKHGVGIHSDANSFFGNQLGSMGETSVFACLLGAIILIYTGVGAWRTMVATGLGAFLCAWAFQFGAEHLGTDGGIWNAAKYAFPAYKHLLIGGLAFGAVFMATDPVSSPTMSSGKWIYGLLIGSIVIVIRTVNPAFPEGVMLAILLGNVFAPLIDYYAVKRYRRKRYVPV